MLRPEHVRVAEADDPDGLLGTVSGSAYFGGVTRINVKVGEETLVVEHPFPAGSRPRTGDRLTIVIDLSRAQRLENPTSKD
ncbi:TOBE domain-containing protein [Rhodobium orientis]|uniref:TOBE domain-containing protein n=1 Tax=Rhodobium orientis TaxID=34017 RepID=UPI003B8A7151